MRSRYDPFLSENPCWCYQHLYMNATSCTQQSLVAQPSEELPANSIFPYLSFIFSLICFHQPLSKLAKISVKASDRLPDHPEWADICQTKRHVHCYESSEANLASLRKASRGPPIADQTEGMPYTLY